MPSSGVQTCALDRKSTRLNSSHTLISYAVFCLKKKQTKIFRQACGSLSWSRIATASRSYRDSSRCLFYALLTPGFLAPFEDVSPFFFFNDTATTEIYTLSLHDALPI